MDMSGLTVILIAVAIILLVLFVITPWRIRRAMKRIIRVCREHRATSAKDAITIERLGVKSQGLLSMGLRNFSTQALDMLIREGIIQVTEDNKFYLLEEKLTGTKLGKPTPYYH